MSIIIESVPQRFSFTINTGALKSSPAAWTQSPNSVYFVMPYNMNTATGTTQINLQLINYPLTAGKRHRFVSALYGCMFPPHYWLIIMHTSPDSTSTCLCLCVPDEGKLSLYHSTLKQEVKTMEGKRLVVFTHLAIISSSGVKGLHHLQACACCTLHLCKQCTW